MAEDTGPAGTFLFFELILVAGADLGAVKCKKPGENWHNNCRRIIF